MGQAFLMTTPGIASLSIQSMKSKHDTVTLADPGLQSGLLVDQGPVVRKAVGTNCPLISFISMHTSKCWLLHICFIYTLV